MPMLEFRKQLAMRMMANKLDHTEVAAASPRCTRSGLSIDHVFKKRAKKEGKWNYAKRQFKECRMLYIPHSCSICHTLTRDYCSCDPGCDLCAVCSGRHVEKDGH